MVRRVDGTLLRARPSVFDKLATKPTAAAGGAKAAVQEGGAAPPRPAAAAAAGPAAAQPATAKGKAISSKLLSRLAAPTKALKLRRQARESANAKAGRQPSGRPAKLILGTADGKVVLGTAEQAVSPTSPTKAAGAPTAQPGAGVSIAAEVAGAGAQQGGGLLHAMLRELEDGAAVQRALHTFGDCGIFTREQLDHALTTRATKGLNLPFEAYFRGRPFLVNELIATCSASGVLIDQQKADKLLEAIAAAQAEEGRGAVPLRGAPTRPPPLTPPTIAADEGAAAGSSTGAGDGAAQPAAAPAAAAAALVEPALSSALIISGRLDARAALARVGVHTVAAFLSGCEGLPGLKSSVFRLAINVQLRAAGEKPLGLDTLTGIYGRCTVAAGGGQESAGTQSSAATGRAKGRGHATQPSSKRGGRKVSGGRPPSSSSSSSPQDRLSGCTLLGSEGAHGGQWQICPRETTVLPGLRGDPVADVCYVEGDMPLVLGVPLGGLLGTIHSAAAQQLWAPFGNGRLERTVRLLASPRGGGDDGKQGVAAGMELTDAQGWVRAVATRALGAADEVLYYRLLPGSRGDWAATSWVYHLRVMSTQTEILT